MSLTSLSDSIQIIASKTVVCLQLYCNCNIIISHYAHIISILIHSLNLIMIHLILATFHTPSRVFVPSTITLLTLIFATLPQLTFPFFRHLMSIPLKLSTSFRTTITRLCIIFKNLTSLAPR